ncbi:Protein moonraker [Frankliniella fusca]|uniref:Protein moonraker n=1 Tax=Frankliniella fusca TaxID=407009 RepID=A0AAE1GXZ3_9NEOP|nr:Protein moonraker [Frankliniella fusca]
MANSNSNISIRNWGEETFQFKYVAEDELLRIVRKVRREKQREKDALQWQRFVEERERAFSRQTANLVEPEVVQLTRQHCSQISDGQRREDLKTALQVESDRDSIPSEAEELNFPAKLTFPNGKPLYTGAQQRIALLRHRISLVLESIIGTIQCRPNEPDGPDDLERRKTRINEFLSRFSRNYLFQFQRQVAELRRHIASASPETPGRHTEYQALMQKLVSAHQTALQSLQAYLSQIPASLQVSNIFGKLKDLVQHLCELTSLKNQLTIHGGLIDGSEEVEDTDDINLKCKELLFLLEEKKNETEDNFASARISSPASGRGSLNCRCQPSVPRTNGSRQASWKKSSIYLARAKFGAPSSIQSSNSPHTSSQGHQSHDRKSPKDVKKSICCNSELKEIINHMHDVLCNKLAARKRRGRSIPKSAGGGNSLSIKKSMYPLTKVQNLSENVQLVITRHCDSDAEDCKDVGTDTADLTGRKSHQEGESKKLKKVVWATGDSSQAEPLTDPPFCERSNKDQQTLSENALSSGNVDSTTKLRKAHEQRIFSYKKRFQEFNTQVQKPIIQRWCDEILTGVFQEISDELEPSFLLEKMYHLEFRDH